MNTPDFTDFRSVLNTVRKWPAAQRFALVQHVLRSLEEELVPRPRGKTMEQARGLLATGRPAPSDAEVEQWLEEERMKKYG